MVEDDLRQDDRVGYVERSVANVTVLTEGERNFVCEREQEGWSFGRFVVEK